MKKNRGYLLFIAPSLGGFIIFYLVPFGISFYNSLIFSPFRREFVGLKNYIDLIKNEVFALSVRNTIIFSLSAVPLLIVISLFIAVVVNKGLYKDRVVKVAIVSPLVCPTASVVIIWHLIFKDNGFLNFILNQTGFNGLDWFNTPGSIVIMISIFIWKNLGYNMILFIAGLNAIPKAYYEVARSFGASRAYIFFRITLIYLAPTTFFVTIISIINSFKVFREIFLLTGAYPHRSLYSLQHYINNTFMKLDIQKMSGASFLTGVFIFIILYISLRGMKKVTFYES